jgi:uncharacterized protein
VFGDELFSPWLADLREQAQGVELFDAHTHIGENDPDGFRCTTDQLTATLTAAGARGVVFPMHEPDGYPPANDQAIAASRESGGRLTAFCRLDPAADPLAEAQRCLDAGAAGIKLHPRAERFALDTAAMEPVFALADERRLPVLVHAGRGIPALGEHAVKVCERHPGLRLILAHAGICDLAWIWQAAPDLPNLLFDTAWWSPSDLLALFTLVPPGNILFASDAPYSACSFAAALNLRCALQAGLSREQMKLVFGGQVAGLLAGEDLVDAGPAPGPGTLDRDPLLDRVYTFLVAGVGQMFHGVDPAESLALAGLACEVGRDAPQAETCAAVMSLIELREEVLRTGQDAGRPERFVPGLSLVVMAAALARTPAVPMPALD